MSITTIFDFENPDDYTLNNISISDSVASLSLVANPGQTFSQALTSSSGFTFDSSKTSITGGVLSQVSQDTTPSLTNVVNGTAGTGTFTKTGATSAWDSGCTSVQEITGDGYVQATAPTNGTVAIGFGLATTNPAGVYSDIDFFIAFNGSEAQIYELGVSKMTGLPYTGGDIFKVVVTSSVVTYVRNNTVIYTSLTSATFPMYFACSLFNQNNELTGIMLQDDATQYLGDSITFPTFTYSGLGGIVAFSGFTTAGDMNSPGYILNGLYWNGMAWVSSNGSYAQSNPKTTVATYINQLPNNNSLIIKVITMNGNAPMSITGPVAVTYSGQIYPVAGGTIQSNSSFSAQEILSFSSILSQSGSDTVTFALSMNGTLMYWNGTAWVVSNGSFAQTNTASVLNTNVPTLLSVNSNIEVFALLVSGTGSTSPNITSMTISYSFGAVQPSAPLTTIVYGFLRDIQSNPIANAQVIFSLVNVIPNAFMSGASHVLIASSVTSTTDMNGYFEQPIIATTQFQGTNTFIQVVIQYTNDQSVTVIENVGPSGQPLYLTIPIQESIDITSILSA